MKLYYAPGACSLASHITIRELGLEVDIIKVDILKEYKTETGEDYYKINPKGYVPYLTIDADTSISEGAVILQYLADQKPEGKMSPLEGTPERYKIQEWLTFIATELHHLIDSFFAKYHFTEAGLKFQKAKLHKRIVILDAQLNDNDFLMGADYTIADAYAFTVMNWIPAFGLDVDISGHKNISEYMNKIQSREAVQTAMKEEGLI